MTKAEKELVKDLVCFAKDVLEAAEYWGIATTTRKTCFDKCCEDQPDLPFEADEPKASKKTKVTKAKKANNKKVRRN